LRIASRSLDTAGRNPQLVRVKGFAIKNHFEGNILNSNDLAHSSQIDIVPVNYTESKLEWDSDSFLTIICTRKEPEWHTTKRW